MICRYTRDQTEYDVSGSKQEWLEFAEKVRSGTAKIHCEAVDPHPYDVCTDKIIVSICNSDLIHAEIVGSNTLSICGNSSQFARLSDLLLSFADVYMSGTHFHLDFIDSGTLISKESGYFVLNML